MMKIRYFFSLFFLFLALPAFSQKLVQKGHEQFRQMGYSEAIVSLEKAVEKGYRTTQIYSELADSYYFNANYTASAKWYKRMFETKNKISPIHYFRYSQSLKSIGKYKEADEILKNAPDSSIEKSESLLQNIAKNSGRYQINLCSFNSSHSDFGPSFFGNQIVFASTRDTGSVFKTKHSWTNQSFTDLYLIQPDSANAKPIAFSKKINSKFNESSAVFTKDGLTMYFTRNNLINNKLGTNKDQTTLLKIYKAVKKDTDWEVVGALPFCSDNYNVAHPALSSDEKTLYFASDMPGGFGQSDLFKVSINPDETYGIPENLGSKINTIGRETFPFIGKNKELYFSSDGHENLGGLDVFVSKVAENFYSKPKNVGEPINSTMDDFGFIFNFETKAGFFTSNRSSDIGIDAIYSLKELIPLPCETILAGLVSLSDKEKLNNKIKVILLDADLNEIQKCVVAENGAYSFALDCSKIYTIRFMADSFLTQEILVESKFEDLIPQHNVILQKEELKFQIGEDIAKTLSIAPIYFDVGKSIIRPDAAIELQKIKKILVENPTLKIDIRSHTDSRDTAQNNLILSANRAKATLNWFVENGIEVIRLTGTGYGETQLLNGCSDGVPCSKAAHQLNRRSEFIVISF